MGQSSVQRKKEGQQHPSPYEKPFEGSALRRGEYEYQVAVDCILPLLRRWGISPAGLRVLDLGCGSGGLSVALSEVGAQCLGLDLKAERIKEARQIAARRGVTAEFITGDVFETDTVQDPFDLVLLSEFIEHLGTVDRAAELIGWCCELLAESGHAYVSFPPWYSPFAGHQAGWPGIRYLPWYHLLPNRLKKALVPSQADAYNRFIAELNHLTIRAFERIVSVAGLGIVRRELYLVRPEYRFRYGTPTLRASLLAEIPLIREITSMGAYYLLAKQQSGAPTP